MSCPAILVQLVEGHGVQQPKDMGLALEVARHIQVLRAVGVARGVHNGKLGVGEKKGWMMFGLH